MLRALFALALLTVTPACFVGRFADNEPLSADQLRTLEPGTTTAAEAVQRLGAPVDVIQLGRRSAYLYAHTVRKNSGFLMLVVGLFNEDQRWDRAWLFFDENDVLSHVGTTLAAERAEYAMPWNDLYDEVPQGQNP